jgi:hypothetical protein
MSMQHSLDNTLKSPKNMSQDYVERKRDWRGIAGEAFAEKDPAKLQRLAEELVEALDERDKMRCQKSA